MLRTLTRLSRIFVGAAALAVSAAVADPPLPLQLPLTEGATHGFPELRDATGRKLADAEFRQIPDGDRLHVTLTYNFGGGHEIAEDTMLRQRPAFQQDTWSWQETRAGEIVRRFAVDFATGEATAETVRNGERETRRKTLKIDRPRTFAGFAFTLALECLRADLKRGAERELTAVAFTPEPRAIDVDLSFAGLEPLTMGTRTIVGERYVIRAKIPAIAKWFIRAPDTQIWLIHPEPTGFLRWQGPLAEPSDDLVRVDLLPGATSGP